MVEISTSVLNIEEKKAVQIFYDLETAKTDYFHIDVMDGKFVYDNTKNKMLQFTSIIKNITNIPLDIHLMVESPREYIDEFVAYEPDYITIHKEVFKSNKELIDEIQYIKGQGVKVGVAINPNTKIEDIYEIIKYVHLILVMTVEPGKGGQTLIRETLEKIKKLVFYRKKENLDFFIEADGGINIENANDVKKAGVDIIVAGTAIIMSDDYKKTIKALKKEDNF